MTAIAAKLSEAKERIKSIQVSLRRTGWSIPISEHIFLPTTNEEKRTKKRIMERKPISGSAYTGLLISLFALSFAFPYLHRLSAPNPLTLPFIAADLIATYLIDRAIAWFGTFSVVSEVRYRKVASIAK